jgi:hypothetical protein
MEAEKNPEKRFWCVVPLDSGKLGWIALLIHCACHPHDDALRWSRFSLVKERPV